MSAAALGRSEATHTSSGIASIPSPIWRAPTIFATIWSGRSRASDDLRQRPSDTASLTSSPGPSEMLYSVLPAWAPSDCQTSSISSRTP